MTPVKRTRALGRWMNGVSPERWTGISLLVLLLAVFAQSYEGRVGLVRSQRAGCERGKLDRGANERAWVAALHARQETASDPTVSERARRAARSAVLVYMNTVGELHSRSLIDCHRAFPSPTPWPG